MKSKDVHPNSAGISQYVRTAEKLMATGNYRTALDALSLAQELDPRNSHLQSIVERALMLEARAAANRDPRGGAKTESQGGRFLSVTIGKQFERGIKENEDARLTPQELHAQVQYLVDTAGVLLDRGLNESAFESLMQAYLLDPLAPELISSEQKILPVLEAMRNRPVPETSIFRSTPDHRAEDSAVQNPDSARRESRFRQWLRRW